MLSRVANHIYWLGRYLERAENYARFIDVNFNLMQDLPLDLKEQWQPLIAATGDMKLYLDTHQTFSRDQVLFFLSFDEKNPNSMINTISNARENARIIRDSLSKETWEEVNELYYMIKHGAEKKMWKKEDPRLFFEKIKNQILLIYGIADNTVARVEGWFFRQLGQFLERADQTSRILDVKYHILLPSPEEVGTPLDFLHWMALLKSVTGFNSYRRLYGNIDPAGVVEFLVLNKYFPRSIYYCIREAEKCLLNISGNSAGGYQNSAEKAMGELRSKLEYAEVSEIITIGLHQYLDSLQLKIIHISDLIDNNFFRIRDNFEHQVSEQSQTQS
ncbi:alpha-E domain-containing protein [Algoriphagus pacificus]|uniref:Alpha-E domain-containing protein n=1 Tax=Algoriphagus pacificus TaxID=2811234 RepID=A0ABS3CHA8_9BACT|nr:alpha-E domain-containing protein [Algoriphagus pacificus]MBN7815536.1 alpha-E domain-containing protein [Algoriphagus pacificus]